MGMMMYMIIVDHQLDMSHHHNATAEDREKYHSTMFLEKQLLPGLSIMNLISFLFCVPVQVSHLPASIFKLLAWWKYADLFVFSHHTGFVCLK